MTGGTGLGATMAKTLIANGASKVYITGRRLEKLEETAKQAVRLPRSLQLKSAHERLGSRQDRADSSQRHLS